MLIPIFIITVTVYNAISEAKHVEEEQFSTLSREKLCEQTMSVLEKSGLLESIAQAYALNDTERLENIIENELKPLIPAHLNFSIRIENDTYSSGASQEFLCSASRVVTGYAKGKPALGYMARAYLTKIRSKTEKRVIGWQRVLTSSCAGEVYCLLIFCWCVGEENNLIINHTFFLPDDFDRTTATNSWFRIILRREGTQAEIIANGNNLGRREPGYYPNIENYLKPGLNYIVARIFRQAPGLAPAGIELGTGSGTILYLEYQTSRMFTGYSAKNYLYEIQSQCAVKYQNSLFVPGNISSINIRIRVEGVNKVYLAYTYGANIYKLLDKSPDENGIVVFNDSEIRNALRNVSEIYNLSLSYKNLSERVFNLNLYFDVEPGVYEADASDGIINCYGARNRKIYGYPESYIEINYKPSTGASLYSIDFATTLDNYEVSGGRCGRPQDPYTAWESVKWKYTVPNNTLPWYLDIWLSCLWIDNVSKQNFYDERTITDRYLLYGTNVPRRDPVDIYTIRFAYTRINEHVMVPGATNYFHAMGESGEETWFGCPSPFHGFRPAISYGIFKYIINAYVPYGQVFPEEGGGYNLTVYYDTNGDNVPEGYINIPVKGGGSVVSVEDLDPENRAIDDAVLRLLDVLNFINDENGENIVNNKYQDASPRDGSQSNPVDIQLTEEMRIESVSMGGIPELYTPITITLMISR